MGNKYIQRTYQCKCGALTKEYVWDNEILKDTAKVNCSECSTKLDNSNLVKSKVNQAVSIRTPTKNR